MVTVNHEYIAPMTSVFLVFSCVLYLYQMGCVLPLNVANDDTMNIKNQQVYIVGVISAWIVALYWILV